MGSGLSRQPLFMEFLPSFQRSAPPILRRDFALTFGLRYDIKTAVLSWQGNVPVRNWPYTLFKKKWQGGLREIYR
jgi:hypothetical protein